MLNYVEIKDTVYRKIDGVELKLDLFVPREKNEEKIRERKISEFFRMRPITRESRNREKGIPDRRERTSERTIFYFRKIRAEIVLHFIRFHVK